MPPPKSRFPAGSVGLLIATPPVIVTPVIVTVGSDAASATPMVRTGLPPLMIVASARLP